MRSSYDASHPIHVGGFTIEDFHGKKRRLTVPEIFIYSSNIGAAKMALDLGVDRHRAFLDKLGLLSRLDHGDRRERCADHSLALAASSTPSPSLSGMDCRSRPCSLPPRLCL